MNTMENDSIANARWHLVNARTILSDYAGIDGKHYTHKQHVKRAGNQAYKGLLTALDTIIGHPEESPDDHYKCALAKLDNKAFHLYTIAYDELCVGMGYVGLTNVDLAQDGLETADELIRWVETGAGLTTIFEG